MALLFYITINDFRSNCSIDSPRPAWLITLDINNASRYYSSMIKSFKCRETEKVFRREHSRKLPPDIQRQGQKKLYLLDAAVSLDDLRIPPGNRLESLAGDRKGQHSIRLNEQWRICFQWKDNDAHNVEIADYH